MSRDTAPCVKWYPKVTSCSTNRQPRPSSLLLPFLPEMSVSRLLRTRACAAAAAAAAAGVEGPGHACLTSGTEGVFEHVHPFSILFVHLFTMACYFNACQVHVEKKMDDAEG